MISLIAAILILGGTCLFSVLYAVSLQPKALSFRFGQRSYQTCGALRYLAMFFEMSVLAGYVLFVFGTEINFKLTTSNPTVIRILGAGFALACLAFMTYATIKAGPESATPSEETTLHHGIYDFMRHPQTLGEMLIWFGISVALNSLTLLLFSLIWLPIFIGFTVVEDNDLALRFGEEYLEYSRKVGIFWKRGAVR